MLSLTVTSECVDGREEVLQVFGVVRLVEGLQALAVQGVLGSAGIESKVDASLVKHTHGFIVITGVVDSVDTDGVDSKLLEHFNVGRERLSVEQRILCIGGATRLVSNTADEEPLVSRHEGIALNSDLRQGQYRSEWLAWELKRTGARLPLWRFCTAAKAPETREAAATAVVKVDLMALFGTIAVCC